MEKGVVVVTNGVIPANGIARVDFVNPRGKPTFARRITVNNTGATAIGIVFPADKVSGTADTPIALAASASTTFEQSATAYLTITGTAAATFQVVATVAG